jgi:hypothetical protein
MNQTDRIALAAIAEQITALTKGLGTLEYLGKEETVQALEDLVRIAPTLKLLAKGYEGAGVLGNLVKWIAGIATAMVGLWALVRLFVFGDAK